MHDDSSPLRRSTTDEPEPRCAQVARGRSEDPVGSAPGADAFVFVTMALPWPSDPASTDVYRAVEAGVAVGAPGRSVRIHLMVGECAPLHRVIVWGAEPGVGSFGRLEALAGPDELGVTAATLVTMATERGARREVVTDTSEWFVCTHGSRDRCCGSAGTRLWSSFQRDGNGRVHRVSHLGGHRFAPTALWFPAGYAWAYLDETAVHDIDSRRVEPGGVVSMCRGGLAVLSPAAQAIDRAALSYFGWAWLSWTRNWSETHGGRIVFEFDSGDGVVGTFEGVATVRCFHEVPACGAVSIGKRKTTPEFEVSDVVVRLAPNTPEHRRPQ